MHYVRGQIYFALFFNLEIPFLIPLYIWNIHRKELLLVTGHNITIWIRLCSDSPVSVPNIAVGTSGSFMKSSDRCKIFSYKPALSGRYNHYFVHSQNTLYYQLHFLEPARSAIWDCRLNWPCFFFDRISILRLMSVVDRLHHFMFSMFRGSSRYCTLISSLEDLILWTNGLLVSNCLNSLAINSATLGWARNIWGFAIIPTSLHLVMDFVLVWLSFRARA